MMGWIYTAISWILLRWHDLWAAVLPGSASFLGTNWDWILSIICLVITVRIILFPIFVKQIRSQRAMQALQPKLKELQTKHKGDQQTLREEMMKLYQSEKVNPLMGCLPMFLQIPVFLGLFHVLQRLDPAQTKNTTLYGWTQQQWDSAAVAKLFNVNIAARFADGQHQLDILQANGVTVKILAGVLILVMMGTTFLTSRQMILKTGWNADPQQRMIQKLMLYGIPFSLLLSGWYFPIGVIVYWVTQNLFSLGQQYWVLHKYPPPAVAGSIPLKQARSAPGAAPAVKGSPNGRAPAPGATRKPVAGAPTTGKAVAPGKAVPPARPGSPGRSALPGKAAAAKSSSAPAKPGAGAKAARAKAVPGEALPVEAVSIEVPGDAVPAEGVSADGVPAAANGSSGGPSGSAPGSSSAKRPAPAAKKTGGGFVNPVEASTGIFRRKREPEPAPVTPAPETRSLAPKPGAKPVTRKAPAKKPSVARKGGSKR